MSYHSNYLITKATLKFNEAISRSTPNLPTVEQVRQGARLEATPQERGHFFAYAREVAGLLAFTLFCLGFISSFFTSEGSFNAIFFGLTMIAATLYVLCLKFRSRQKKCETSLEVTPPLPPIVFSTATLLQSILIGMTLGIIVYLYLILQQR